MKSMLTEHTIISFVSNIKDRLLVWTVKFWATENKEEAEIHRNPAVEWCYFDDVADGIVTNGYRRIQNWRPN